MLLRRSRGCVPDSVPLPVAAARPLLACGAELKSTFCVAKGRRAWVSHHIGDLENWETLRSFREGIEHFERLFAVRPELVAYDLHPDYLSTKEALERDGVEHVGVQHHHAHLAGCLAEHGEEGPAVGAIFDGTGYGLDRTVWGGELLVGGLTGFERVGSLWPVRLPGGERAIREPWRMACAWLVATQDEPALPAPLRGRVAPERWEQVAGLARSGVASPVTTSMGRLFDAVAALCGLRTHVNYEGQAAAELEAVADRGERAAYPLPLLAGERLLLDARPTVAAALEDRDDASLVSARFHNAVAAATRRRLRPRGRGSRARHGRPVRRRVPEPPAARARRDRPGRRRPARARAAPAAAQRRRDLVRAGGRGGGALTHGARRRRCACAYPLGSDRAARRADREPVCRALAADGRSGA